MADLLFSSLLTLSLGCLLSLPFVSVREIGRGFFTLWASVVVLLAGTALALRAGGMLPSTPGEFRIDAILVATLATVVLFWGLLRAGALRLASAALRLAAGLAGAELVLVALTPAAGRADQGAPTLHVSSLLLSALAVGLVTVAMVLGHWYLVQPGLRLSPLRRLCDLLLGVLIARLLVTGWGVAASLASGYPYLGGPDPLPWELIILAQRLLFGFVGSLILAVMIRKTVALRSTMSATGLLYIAILFVWVGEFLSLYIGRLTSGGLVV